MMPTNDSREKKQAKAKKGMRVSGRSAFVISEAGAKRNKAFIEEVQRKHNKRKGK